MTEARPANEERGELALYLAGTAMALRPSYEAIMAYEAAVGRGSVQLAREALQAKLTLAETAQIACECIKAFGRDADDKGLAASTTPRIAALILDSEGGFHEALSTIAKLLSLAVTGGYDSSGKLKPLTTTTTNPGTAPVDG